MIANKIIKEENKNKYHYNDLPKISNYLIYNYRVFMKLFWISFIGLGSLSLTLFLFPIFKIFIHPKNKFRFVAQHFISKSFRIILFLLKITFISKLITDSKKELFNLHSKIVVANHPSILDTVILLALIPNATIIASAKYSKGILGGVIKTCYLTNSLNFDELCKKCKESIDAGNNVIIFPEGTRTPRHGQNQFKKGAARIAKVTGANILPIFIGGSDKFGLGKYDPFWSFNHVEQFVYHIILLKEINISEYKEFSNPISAKRITNLCKQRLCNAADQYKKNHPYTITVNNF